MPPEVISKWSQTGWEEFFRLQREWLERMMGGKKEKAPEGESRPSASNFLDTWMDFYEKQFGRFFTIPQLGLSRFHQERMGELLDKFNRFSGNMTAFLYSLMVPWEKSFRGAQEKVEKLLQDGKLSQDPREYYQVWIKVLEDYYLSLLRSEEYTRIMNQTLNALAELLAARQKVLQAFLQMESIPTMADLDDMSRECYQMKKRIRELEKELKSWVPAEAEAGWEQTFLPPGGDGRGEWREEAKIGK